MLHGLKNLSIDFLSTLDYVDLQNLCHTDKALSGICRDNTILRNILYQTYNTALEDSIYAKKYKKKDIELPQLYLPPNFPIAEALRSLYDNILALVDVNYPDYDFQWPRWINRENFKEDMVRQIYYNLYFKITAKLYEKSSIAKAIKKIKSVDIDAHIITFPFVAFNEDQYISEMAADDNKYTRYINNTLIQIIYITYLVYGKNRLIHIQVY
jgi:hypothetical protein